MNWRPEAIAVIQYSTVMVHHDSDQIKLPQHNSEKKRGDGHFHSGALALFNRTREIRIGPKPQELASHTMARIDYGGVQGSHPAVGGQMDVCSTLQEI
mmetsp:Transcript_2739/g.7663  ORF Transcript_2739/g.7663 Transcript_2739/m.7663 type:complete len:98 (+) Transcript_2739:304-597(+)